MRNIICEKCKNEIPLITGLNSRVIDYDRKETDSYVKLTCILGVYCSECGKENKLGIQRYFSVEFSSIPTRYLIEMVLRDNGI